MKPARRCPWTQAGRTLEHVEKQYNQTKLSRFSFIEGLRCSDDDHLRRLARQTSLPFCIKADPIPRGHAGEVLPQRLLWQALSSLLTRRPVQISFSHWHQMFRQLQGAHLRVQQLSAQSRAQVNFLVGFVPVVGLLVCSWNWSTFTENIKQGLGSGVFGLAALLYGCGVWFSKRLINSAAHSSRRRRMNHTGQQLQFLSEILSRSSDHGHRFGAFLSACLAMDDADLRLLSKRLSLAFDSRSSSELSSPWVSSSEFIDEVWSGFVDSPSRQVQWLMDRHAVLFDKLCAEGVQSAAVLSVQLVFPMAIFFLPALFLILALCGFSLGGDTLNSL